MKTSTTKENTKLNESFALWKNTKGDMVYYTGKTATATPVRLVAFVNTKKKSENQPDINVYEQVEKDQEKPQVATLWLNKSKAGKEYYSGIDNEGQKLVGFINQYTQDGKYPAIRVYFSDNK